jgi:hypothetical protein
VKAAILLLICFATVLAGVLGFVLYRRAADWEEVERSAMRLEAGFRHEAVIMVRSKMADLDAAVNRYVQRGTNRGGERRVLAVGRALEHAETGLADLPERVYDHGRSWSTLQIGELRRDVSLTCSEREGILYANGSDVKAGHVKSALWWLATARGQEAPAMPDKLDVDGQRRDCSERANLLREREERAEAAWRSEEAARRAERQRAETARRGEEAARWAAAPLHLAITPFRTCWAEIRSDEDHVAHSGYIGQGETKRAGAMKTIRLQVADPECWNVVVNDKPRKLAFSGAGLSWSATIAVDAQDRW